MINAQLEKTLLVILVLLGGWSQLPSQSLAENFIPTQAASIQPKRVTLIAALPRNFPPQYHTDSHGKPYGFAVDVLEKIAADLQVDISYQLFDDWPTTFAALSNGQADIIPNLSISDQRLERFDFTSAVETTAITIFVRSTTHDITKLEDLRGRKTASVKGNIAIDLLGKDPQIPLVIFDQIETALFALLSSEVDAFVYPMPWVQKLASAARVANRIKIVGPPLYEVKRAIAVRKNQPQLLARLSGAIEHFKTSDEYRQIYRKWFGSPEPYWTVEKVAWTSGIIATVVALGIAAWLIAWRYRSIVTLNTQLSAIIAEREQTQLALMEREENFRTLTQNARDGILVVHNNKPIFVNQCLADMLHYTPSEIYDLSVDSFTPPEEKQNMQSRFHRLKTNPAHAERYESTFITAQGERIAVEICATTTMWHAQACELISARDISERKQAEYELKRHKEQLEVLVAERTNLLELSNKELESFSYSVSHDLRAPLRSINGFSQMIAEDFGSQLNETANQYLQRIKQATNHMALLIDDLLTLARVTRQEIQKHRVNLSNTAKKVCDAVAERYAGATVDIDIEPELFDDVDDHLITIALTNLFDNAFKYTGKKPNPKIEFGSTKIDSKKTYYIRDNGAGFDMRYAAKLFTAFQRLHRPEEFTGTGIGLATVFRIIKRHGGRLWAEGIVEHGATFYFSFE